MVRKTVASLILVLFGAISILAQIDYTKQIKNIPPGLTQSLSRGDRQPILVNADFEGTSILPPPGWTAVSNPTLSYETSTQAPNKTQSLKVVSTGTQSGVLYNIIFPVVAGDTYSLQCASKSDGTAHAQCFLGFYDKAGALQLQVNTDTASTSWVTQTVVGTVPATAIAMKLFLFNVITTGTEWFDQISIQKTNFPGNLVSTGTTTLSGSNTFSGPIVATGTDSGNQTITGNKSFSGVNTYTGTSNTFTALSGCQHVNASQSFAAALAVGGVTCISVDPGTFTVSANASVPASVGLQFSKGGLLSIATGVTLTINSPIYASPDAAIFVYVGTGTTVITGNNGVISSAWFPGADICAQINTAFKSMTAHGAVVDARHYASGNQACGTNMFSGVTVGGQLLLGVYTIQTTVSQVITTKIQVEGAGRGDSGIFGTVIQAVAGFPTTTVPVIQWAAGTIVGARWKNVTVDCNNITNAIGVQNFTAQEESGFSYGIIRDCPGGGLDVETTGTQNSGPWDNLEIAETNLCTNCVAASVPAKFKNTTPSRGFKSSTVNAFGAPTLPSALVLIDSNAFSMEDVNLENNSGDGVLLGSQVGALGIVLKNLSCFTLTNCVHVSNLQNAGNISMFGISSTGSVTNFVKDDTTGRTVPINAISQSGKLGWYMIGEAARGATAPVFTDALTVPAGVPYVPCTTSQKTETAADANLLTCPIPAVAGSYRLRFVMSISAATSATLGWNATWTDSNGINVSPTNMVIMQTANNSVLATTVTGVANVDYNGWADIDVNNSGNPIVIKLTFSGTSFTAKVSASVERII